MQQQQADAQAQLAGVKQALASQRAVATVQQLGEAVSAEVEAALDAAAVVEKRRLIRAVCGGSRLVVTRLNPTMVRRIQARPDYWHGVGPPDVVGEGPLAGELPTLGLDTRLLTDRRFKNPEARGGWRITPCGTIDVAQVVVALAQIGQQYMPETAISDTSSR